MQDTLEAAVEAAAKAMYDALRERNHFRWENASDLVRSDIRALVRPAAEAAAHVVIAAMEERG